MIENTANAILENVSALEEGELSVAVRVEVQAAVWRTNCR